MDPERIPELTGTAPRCATAGGLSLHANVAVPPNDRARLERPAVPALRGPAPHPRRDPPATATRAILECLNLPSRAPPAAAPTETVYFDDDYDPAP